MNTPWQITESGVKSFQCEGWTVTVQPFPSRIVEVRPPETTVLVYADPDCLSVFNSDRTSCRGTDIPWPIVEAIMEARSIVATRTL